MKFGKTWAVYFSATGTTKKIVTELAHALAQSLKTPLGDFDFTLPAARTAAPAISAEDLVVFGVPVYAGRVPNVLLKYLATIESAGAVALPVSVYGNRDYDDALIELKDILEERGFHVLSAGAFVGEHSFSDVLAKGRPDESDIATVFRFAEQVAEKARRTSDKNAVSTPRVKGAPKPYRGYYQPRNADGTPADLRKVKPEVDGRCNGCLLCARVCPMGSISFDNVREYRGICIKCGACVKKCPQKARYYQDAAYLCHKRELEERLTRRAEPELFL
ncbi:MAG: EFR1 family ferrodoxin [Synergistaceae bacterium]|jgi:ferredoxin|nr:EFR1 family ferrodoxin [Synergistaceae bacterium]